MNKRILTALIGTGAMDSLGDRTDLYGRIDSALKNAEQISERNKSNIKDLFGDEAVVETEDLKDKEIDFDPVSAEWNALGFYLDSHPLEDVKKREVRNMCGFLFLNCSQKLINKE